MRYVSRRYLLPVFLACAIFLTILSAAMAQGTTPGAPENLNISVNQGSIYLTWSPPMDQGNSSIIAYLIYRGESPGAEGYYAETGSTSFEDFGVNPGTTYYYQVSARNDDGEGPRSNEVSASIEIPKYTLSGRVTDRGSGDGVYGARLEFLEQGPDPEQFETWTDGSGSYNIELSEGNYQVRVEADGYDTIEDFIYLNSQQNRNFEFDENGNGNGGSDDFNLSDILGIDEDEVKGFVMTVLIIAGAIFAILPLTMLIMVILLIMVFYRLGKVRKELRARNEEDGIFISKRRRRKHEKKTKKEGPKKEAPPPKEENKKTVKVEEEEEEAEEEED
ncbi:MAG: carboxypeptidase regulatory-like domain-containing protein [Thermoplasmatota archaeon]